MLRARNITTHNPEHTPSPRTPSPPTTRHTTHRTTPHHTLPAARAPAPPADGARGGGGAAVHVWRVGAGARQVGPGVGGAFLRRAPGGAPADSHVRRGCGGLGAGMWVCVCACVWGVRDARAPRGCFLCCYWGRKGGAEAAGTSRLGSWSACERGAGGDESLVAGGGLHGCVGLAGWLWSAERLVEAVEGMLATGRACPPAARTHTHTMHPPTHPAGTSSGAVRRVRGSAGARRWCRGSTSCW